MNVSNSPRSYPRSQPDNKYKSPNNNSQSSSWFAANEPSPFPQVERDSLVEKEFKGIVENLERYKLSPHSQSVIEETLKKAEEIFPKCNLEQKKEISSLAKDMEGAYNIKCNIKKSLINNSLRESFIVKKDIQLSVYSKQSEESKRAKSSSSSPDNRPLQKSTFARTNIKTAPNPNSLLGPKPETLKQMGAERLQPPQNQSDNAIENSNSFFSRLRGFFR